MAILGQHISKPTRNRGRRRQTTSQQSHSQTDPDHVACVCAWNFFCIRLRITGEPMECKHQIVYESRIGRPPWAVFIGRDSHKKTDSFERRNMWRNKCCTHSHPAGNMRRRIDGDWGQPTQRPSTLTSAEECRCDSTDIPRHVGSNCLIERVCCACVVAVVSLFSSHHAAPEKASANFCFLRCCLCRGTVFVLFTIRVCCCTTRTRIA